MQQHVFNTWDLSKDFKGKDIHKNTLELIVSSACNTACNYCYYKNFKDALNPVSLCGEDNILTNLVKLLEFFKTNNLFPEDIEIFSGEFFKLPFYKKFLEILYSYIPDNLSVTVIVPTNGTFCLSETSLRDVETTLQKYHQSKMRLALSLSIDGYYCDNISRPLKNGKKYTEEFYDRIMKFSGDHRLKFHPMIDSCNIKYWKENFKWFIEAISKSHNISLKEALDWIYLLEVRNPDWSKEDLDYLSDFIEYVYDYILEIYDNDIPELVYSIMSRKLLNLSSSLLHTIGRGIGCSIQNSFAVKLANLSIVNCHRSPPLC